MTNYDPEEGLEPGEPTEPEAGPFEPEPEPAEEEPEAPAP